MKRFGILMATAALGAALMASGPAAAFRGGWHGGGWLGGGWRGAGWHGGWNRGYGWNNGWGWGGLGLGLGLAGLGYGYGFCCKLAEEAHCLGGLQRSGRDRK
jgi:hypothetical protein